MALLDYGRSRIPELLGEMSQTEFAKRLGVSDSYISQVIRGTARLSLLKAKIASDILNCTVEDLYEWKIIPSGKRPLE